MLGLAQSDSVAEDETWKTWLYGLLLVPFHCGDSSVVEEKFWSQVFVGGLPEITLFWAG